MNQILGTKLKKDLSTLSIPKNLTRLKFVFFFSIFVIIVSLIIYFFIRYNSLQNEKIAKSLKNKFEIHNLYSNANNRYLAKKTSIDTNNIKPFVIGLIQIDKIDLMYPILSESSDELLEMSPCRFYGPMPNEVR